MPKESVVPFCVAGLSCNNVSRPSRRERTVQRSRKHGDSVAPASTQWPRPCTRPLPGARALPRQGSSSVVDAGAHSVRRWTPPNPTQGCSQWLWFAGLHEGRNAGGCTTHGTGSGYYAQYSAALASAQHYAGTVLVPVLLLGRFGLANSSQLSPFGRWATSKGVVVFPVARLDFQEDLVRTLSHLKKGNDHLMGPFLSPSHREHHAGSPRAVILAST